ncbi:cell wall-binding repeat-containing protein [Euzebya pacifica]|uniref:cell wall-binding repeat-containing protein n=1 Tax=Euzebya pacifica TaxID=1608957 RepID=UPI003C6CCFC5
MFGHPLAHPLFRLLALVVGLLLSATLLLAPAHAAAQSDVPSIIFLARADDPVDALSAGAVAGHLGAGLLLSGSESLGSASTDGLLAFAPDLVILTGGEMAIAESVAAEVAALGFATRRVGGPDRFATAAALTALLDEYGVAEVVGERGPQGDPGETGPRGADGAPGARGPAGPTGADGPAGPAGPPGPAGADGADGAAGPEGPQGPTGTDGPAGPAGPAGAQGADGPAGPAGPVGAQGADGPAGPAGPAGPTGAQGADGPPGADGPAGPAGPEGPQGPAGADGAVTGYERVLSPPFRYPPGRVRHVPRRNQRSWGRRVHKQRWLGASREQADRRRLRVVRRVHQGEWQRRGSGRRPCDLCGGDALAASGPWGAARPRDERRAAVNRGGRASRGSSWRSGR